MRCSFVFKFSWYLTHLEQTACGWKSTSGLWDFFFCSSRRPLLEMSKILTPETRARSFSFLALLMVFATISGFTLIPVRSPSSKIPVKNSFCQSLNGDLEDTTFKCRRPRNEWLNCLACYCRKPWSRNARTRRLSECYKAKLIARQVLRQKGKSYWPIFQLAELVFFRASN